MCCDSCSEILGAGDGAGVVDPGGFVEFTDIGGTGLRDTLLESITSCSSSGAICNHLGDGASRAGVLNRAIVT